MRQFHDGMIAKIQTDGEFAEPIPFTNGVKQGCELTSTLLSMMFSAMLTQMFSWIVTVVYILGIALMGSFST